jgi:hypothetical protein
MKSQLGLLLCLLIGVLPSLRAAQPEHDGQWYVDQLRLSMSEILTENQGLINSAPDGSVKNPSLSPESFLNEVQHGFAKNVDVTLLAGSKDPERISAALAGLLQAGRDHCAKLQPAINTEKDGSTKMKKFIPAIFGRLCADRFLSKTGVAIKQTTLGKGEYGARNNYNKPDTWETASLTKVSGANWEVDKGVGESLPGKYRYLKPIYIKQACLTCHGNPVGTDAPYGHKMEGYEPGEIRGGISVSLPLK